MAQEYVIVRTVNAGVFAGTLTETDLSNGSVTLQNARRLWYWAGAASLSQLAQEGTKQPKDCKFPTEVDQVILLGVIEILSVTADAKDSIAEVPVWAK